MNNNLIIQVLKEKERKLLADLQQIQTAIQDFFNEHPEIPRAELHSLPLYGSIPGSYEECRTYTDKILFILKKSDTPMLISEVAAEITKAQPDMDEKKLYRTVAYSLNMLLRAKRVKKHHFTHHRKYSILS